MDGFEDLVISDKNVRIDRALCIGSGSCVNLAPEDFELDSSSIVTFTDDPPDIESDRLVEACELCPVDALIVTDEEGQIVP